MKRVVFAIISAAAVPSMLCSCGREPAAPPAVTPAGSGPAVQDGATELMEAVVNAQAVLDVERIRRALTQQIADQDALNLLMTAVPEQPLPLRMELYEALLKQDQAFHSYIITRLIKEVHSDAKTLPAVMKILSGYAKAAKDKGLVRLVNAWLATAGALPGAKVPAQDLKRYDDYFRNRIEFSAEAFDEYLKGGEVKRRLVLPEEH